MRQSAVSILKRKPFFLFLLPLFFVFHGYVSNLDIVPVKDAFLLFLRYLIISGAIYLLFRIIFKDNYKAALFASFILAINFFFGPFHDFLKSLFGNSFVVKYSFLLPLLVLIVLSVFFLLKRNQRNIFKVVYYINVLLVVLIFIDAATLTIKFSHPRPSATLTGNGFEDCKSCERPDVYLIVADGYPGDQELNDLFSYDNTQFENELKKRGFFLVTNPKSNYNFTPFSIASMLNMDYLKGIKGSNSDKSDISLCYNTIKDSKTLLFFRKQGYKIYNYSIFDLYKNYSIAKPTFLMTKTRPILSQTLLYRLRRDLGYHLVTTLKLGWVMKQWRNGDLKNNQKLISLTSQLSKQQQGQPKFVYTHLVMPHYPYYFDSAGKPVDYTKLTDENAFDKSSFLSYLKFCNKTFLKLIDEIKATPGKPPIIIFMSDHGFREFKESVDQKYYLMNINAIYFPDSNYTKIPEGISNVNQFRVILNSKFRQHLAILPDTSLFLAE
jgi:hypothetical protein